MDSCEDFVTQDGMNRIIAAVFLFLSGCRSSGETKPDIFQTQPSAPPAAAPVPLETDPVPEEPTSLKGVTVSTEPAVQDAIAAPAPPIALVLPNEKVVFSFQTKKGKTMNIVIDNEQRYMAYRYGTEDHIELQFPSVLENTFSQFTYSYYMRGGGPENDGVDLNHLVFSGAAGRFTVYSEQHYEDDKEIRRVGIRVTNLKTGKEREIPGRIRTVKGSLIEFRPGWDLGDLVAHGEI